MTSRLILTAMLGTLMGAIGYAPAQAEELDADEVTYASYGVMCLERASKTGDQQSLAFWTAIKSDIEPKYWTKATANLNAVKESLDGIDPALIEKRCSEFQAIFEDEDYTEEPISDELVALNDKIKDETSILADAMLRGGFAADDLNIPLKLSVQFSNRIDDRLTMAREMDGLFSKMAQALNAQQSQFDQGNRQDILAVSDKTLNMCRWAAHYGSYIAVQNGQYGRASYALTQSVLWAGLSHKRASWGGARYTPSSAEAMASLSVDKLSDWKTLSSTDEALLIGMDTACKQYMNSDFTSAHITPALSAVYPNGGSSWE